MRMALLSMNKLMFIDKAASIPRKSKTIFPIRERCNNLVLSRILKSFPPTIAQSMMWFDLAKDVYRVLSIRFPQGIISE